MESHLPGKWRTRASLKKASSSKLVLQASLGESALGAGREVFPHFPPEVVIGPGEPAAEGGDCSRATPG